MSHDQPTYASVPGIRVYGMMCAQVNNNRRGRHLRFARSIAREYCSSLIHKLKRYILYKRPEIFNLLARVF